MTDLDVSLRALVAQQPPVADWPALVRQRVVRRSRRRRVVVAASAAAVLGIGLGVSASGGPDRSPDVPAASPEPRPTADESTPLVVFVDPEPTDVPAGTPVEFVVVARSFLERAPVIPFPTLDGRATGPVTAYSCPGYPPGATQPPLRREHGELRRTFSLTLSPGRHTLVVAAEAGCARPGGTASHAYEIIARP